MAEVVEQTLEGTMSPELALEMESLKTTERAALLMLLLGEQQASDIVGYLNPKEVQALGTAMVGVSDVSQEAVDKVLDEFITELKKQTNLGLGSPDYIEGVLNRALGPERASSVLSRILPSSSSKGLEILSWMTPRSICDMVGNEHPQVIAIDHLVGTGRRNRSRRSDLPAAGYKARSHSPGSAAGYGSAQCHGRVGVGNGQAVCPVHHYILRSSRRC